MEELIQKITLKAYKISTKTKADVFVDYSGHVNSICIYFYKNGWQEDIEWDFRLDFSLEIEKEAITKLEFTLKQLEKLEEK